MHGKEVQGQNLLIPKKFQGATQGCDSAVSLFVLGPDPSKLCGCGSPAHLSEPPSCSFPDGRDSEGWTIHHLKGSESLLIN